jgi:hypothetical protein
VGSSVAGKGRRGSGRGWITGRRAQSATLLADASPAPPPL